MSTDTTTDTTTETTIVDVGRPPVTIPEHTWKGENVPHRDLPHTGTDSLLLPSAGLCLVVGLVLTVVARKRHRKRYYVEQGAMTGRWWVRDRRTDMGITSFSNKQAAKNRAAVLNANIPSLADSKGWKA